MLWALIRNKITMARIYDPSQSSLLLFSDLIVPLRGKSYYAKNGIRCALTGIVAENVPLYFWFTNL